MNRVCLDTESNEIKRFVRRLPMEGEGVELELNGKIVCKVVPVTVSTDAERQALVDERWKIIQRAQERTRGLPPKVVQRDIERAVDEVRKRIQR